MSLNKKMSKTGDDIKQLFRHPVTITLLVAVLGLAVAFLVYGITYPPKTCPQTANTDPAVVCAPPDRKQVAMFGSTRPIMEQCTCGDLKCDITCQPGETNCTKTCAQCFVDADCPGENTSCVNNTCKQIPPLPCTSDYCKTHDCGTDECGNQCNTCISPNKCDADGKCSPVDPTCTDTYCETHNCGMDKCNISCGPCDPATSTCTDGMCVQKPSPPPPAQLGDWQGWATTSQFGAGEQEWPSGSQPSISLSVINDAKAKRMGAAIPWADVPKSGFASRTDQLNAIIDSARGKPMIDQAGNIIYDKDNNKQYQNACFLAQPITRYPDELNNINDPAYVSSANLCQPGKSCVDVNDPSIAAKLTNSQDDYPSFLIVPYEGCGGDCNVNRQIPQLDVNGNQAVDPTTGKPVFLAAADCFNSCGKIQDFVKNFDQGAAGINDTTDAPLCGTIKTFYNGDGDAQNKWTWNEQVHQQYLEGGAGVKNQFAEGTPGYGNAEIAITGSTNYGRNILDLVGTAGKINYCSTQNMHFDTAITDPFWSKIGNAQELTGDTQIMVRYKRVPCNINGTFDPKVYPMLKNTGSCKMASDCASNNCQSWFAEGVVPDGGCTLVGTDGCCVAMKNTDTTCDVFGGCGDHGMCQTLNGRHECICFDGYKGLNCDRMPHPCTNECVNGQCNTDTGNCVCSDGWYGAKCDTQQDGPTLECDPLCGPNANCTAGAPGQPNNCVCKYGFTGEDCHKIPVTSGNICGNVEAPIGMTHCIPVPNNPGKATVENCLPCETGQTFWPCNFATDCQWSADAPAPPPPFTSSCVADSCVNGCLNFNTHNCDTSNSVTSSEAACKGFGTDAGYEWCP